LISQATGSFQDVSPKITEKGKVANAGPEVANAFSLQLNSELFATPACSKSGDPAKCRGWQQFLYTTQDHIGYVYMQYWLINYHASCPSGWSSSAGDCWTNSPASRLTGGPLTARELATVKLSGSAASGGKDKVSLSVGSGHATLVTNNDSKLDLAAAWNTTEWGVFGDGSRGEAYFGTGATLAAKTALTTPSASPPACVQEGFTGETNNLSLASTAALGRAPSPTMASRQTNGTSGTASCAVTGATWTAARPPLPAGANSTSYSSIADVSCPSATSCLASGYYTDTSGVERGLLLTWSDGAWTAAQAPYIDNLSCVTATFCVSVNGPEILTWAKGTWTTTSAPAPADNGSDPVSLESVSCASASFCVAAGAYTNAAGHAEGVLETWSDGTWTAARAPLPAHAAANPEVVFGPGNLASCPSVSFCVAAGDYTDTSRSTEGLLETWSHGKWTARKAPLPAGAASRPDVVLLGLSCPTASHCLATGSYNDTSGSVDDLLATWSGSSWSPTSRPASDYLLGPVACVSASACVIAGSKVATSSGGSWTAEPLPAPPYGVYWDISNLSCASASCCVAAGESTDAAGEHWRAAIATGAR
jgi:hypothetical protein